jgi:hypothetical protein
MPFFAKPLVSAETCTSDMERVCFAVRFVATLKAISTGVEALSFGSTCTISKSFRTALSS